MNNINLYSKRSFSFWFSATIYAITAGIIIPYITGIVLTGRLPFTIMIGSISPIRSFLIFISPLIGIWLGVFLSTKYLFEKQVARGGRTFVNIATFQLLVILLGIQALSTFSFYERNYDELFVRSISIIITIALFYFFSRRYIRQISSRVGFDEIGKSERQDRSLAKQPKYVDKIFFFGHNISFLIIFTFNLIIAIGLLFFLPSIFTLEHYPTSGWISTTEASDYVSAEKVTFLIALSLSFIFLLFFNIRKAKSRGLLNVFCLLLAFSIVEFVFMGTMSSPHECPSVLYPGFGYYQEVKTCVRTLNHILFIFLFLPLIYGTADAINRKKGNQMVKKRALTLSLGILVFFIIKQTIFVILTLAL
ncbi:hypothetical protein B6D52_02775 [Candidatus Parcubacteria bacterium 4484_255]|nr:MAG: hypothetical protein B6D52_02775 [Candidatus Parcubacteria bacterium 4484_255]